MIIADNPTDLQKMLNRINEEGKKVGLKINANKTKTMVITRDQTALTNIQTDGERIENVGKFKYLGTLIIEKRDPSLEINTRIA